MTDDLIAFLRAQLDEDERVALLADAHDWRYPVDGVIVDRDVDGWQSAPDAARIFSFLDPDRSDEAAHAVRHDPARVLAEVDAKRRILDEHEHFPVYGGFGCGICAYNGRDGVLEPEGWCATVRLLALPYADRAGYRDEWRP